MFSQTHMICATHTRAAVLYSHLHRNAISHRRVEPMPHRLCRSSNNTTVQHVPSACPIYCSWPDCSIFHTAMDTFALSQAINENELVSIKLSPSAPIKSHVCLTQCSILQWIRYPWSCLTTWPEKICRRFNPRLSHR